MKSSPTEQDWRALAWLPGYEVSESGLLRRCVAKGYCRVGRLSKAAMARGYVRYWVTIDGKGRWVAAHRLVCEAWHGPPPKGGESHAAHWDGQRDNNHFTNLRWATPAENSADRSLHGTDSHAERNGRARLTWAAVSRIRADYRGRGEQVAAYAQEFGVCTNAIRSALYGITWKPKSTDECPLPKARLTVREICTRGHLRTPENRTKKGECVLCKRITRRRWQQENREYLNAYHRERRKTGASR